MHKKPKIVSIANQKGGVGKTTTAINLSACLPQKSKVLVIDSDPQGNASSGLGLPTKKLAHHLYHAYTGDSPLDNIIQKTYKKHVFLIPSNIDLVAAEFEMIGREKREFVLRDLLKNINNFDYIIIDCPPSLGLLTINALVASDSVIVPMQCEYFAMEGLAQLISTIRSVKKSFNSNLFIEGLILTMFDRRNRLTHQVAQEIRTHFGEQVFKTVIPRNVRLSECPSHGLAITDYDSSSTGAKAYTSLAREFIKRQR